MERPQVEAVSTGTDDIYDFDDENEVSNSVIPTSLHGLLAEEWTVNPHSPMPSFLERVFMQEAQESAYKGLQTVYQDFIDYVERLCLSLLLAQQQQLQQQQQSSAHHETFVPRVRRILRRILHQVLQRFTHMLRRHRLAILCLCIYAIERISLEKSSCTLAESFYGGHRVKLVTASKDTTTSSSLSSSQNTTATIPTIMTRTAPLQRHDKVRLAGWLALSLYLKGKLEEFLQHHDRSRNVSWVHNATNSQTEAGWLLATTYRWIKLTVQGASFLYQWNYLLGNSPFFDIPSAVLHQWVRRKTRQDLSVTDTPTTAVASASTSRPTPEPNGRQILIQKASATILSVGVCLSWFAWCRSTWLVLVRNQDSAAQTIPPAPSPPVPPVSGATSKSLHPESCCVCGTLSIQQPTACTVSGWVGCQTCIQNYLARHKQCPVTQQPCTAQSWVRLYEPRS